MSYEDAMTEALRTVLEFDLAEEACWDALSVRATLLAGVGSDEDTD